ncbi:hypothetical protein PV783_30165 [Chitinophaga sp. CC14]|uniref:hypothetical protein n=1 Tax=Chitinophaga sp. CC14 TaxID=3029199 RepID=UPI003B7DC773
MECIPLLDICCKIATIVIAAVNVGFVIYFFYKKSRNDNADKEKDRKISWLKTLILDNSFKYFYTFFDELQANLELLKAEGLDDDQKKNIDTASEDLFITLRRRFIDGLLAIDDNLYSSILKSCDELQEQLTDAIFDPGIKLSHIPKFNEQIVERLTVAKTAIIKQLFNYRG